MATLYSNELKALVAPENILELKSVLQEKFATVELLNYCCRRQRNSKGEAYGPTEPVELEFSIRLNSPSDVKPYYEKLTSNESFTFSFVFNAVFEGDNQNKKLKNYDDGMVCKGYVVGIEEQFSTTRSLIMGDDTDLLPNDEQMIVNIKLLLMNTTYIGTSDDNNYESTFIQ